MTDKKLTPPPRPPEPLADTVSLPGSGSKTVSRVATPADQKLAQGSGAVVVVGLTCHRCAAALNSDTAFCPRCGTKVSRAGLDGDIGATSRVIEAGTILGDYRIHRLLGEGGMGRVYLAEHMLLGRKVALKKLRSEFSGNREAVKRFFGEARAVNRIAHENIIEITDFVDDDEDGSYYIMELLEGNTLDEVHHREGVLPLDRVIPIAVQIASALKAVHRAGIVHRDLKPENIFLTAREDGADLVKLLDFGVAKLTAEDGTISVNSTQQGAILGTPEYMSPEQASGKEIDERSDIYSFGVILFEMVTGGRPFEADNFGDIVVKHVTYPVPEPSKWPGAPYAIPDELERLIMSCLAKQPADRLGSMSEVELALRALYEAILFDSAATTALHRALPPMSSGPIRMAPQPSNGNAAMLAATPANDADVDVVEPLTRSKKWPLVGVVTAIVAVVALLALRGGGSSDTRGDEPTRTDSTGRDNVPSAVTTSDGGIPAKDNATPPGSPAQAPGAGVPAAAKPKSTDVTDKTAAKAGDSSTNAKHKPSSRRVKKPRNYKKWRKRSHRRSRNPKKTSNPIDKNAVIDPFDE